jgi:hypothetical protein
MSTQVAQSHLTARFLEAIQMVAELPEEQQDELAQSLFDEIADLKWEDLHELHAAIEEAEAEYAAGDYITFEEYDRQRQAAGG